MECKLLVLDIDGTLTNGKKEITPYTIKILHRVQQSGVKIVLASGRPTYGITPLAEQLEMFRFGGYILSFNGGKIIDLSNSKTIYKSTLPKPLIPDLYKMAIDGGTTIITYQDQYIITESPNNKYVQHELFLTKMEAKRVDYFPDAVTFTPDKCLIVGEPDNLPPIQQTILDRFQSDVNAFRSEPFFLEVVPKGIDKALSLSKLLEYTGHSQDQIIAVGDGFNDLSMVEFAGFGVAMANAQQELKNIADYITLSNEEDGVADMALKFILK